MTVHVVHDHKEMRGGEFVSKYDMSSAERFGQLSYLLDATHSAFRPRNAIEVLEDKLRDFGDEDYLLLVGNPVLLGLAMTIAVSNNRGRAKVLQWSTRNKQYDLIEIVLEGYDE